MLGGAGEGQALGAAKLRRVSQNRINHGDSFKDDPNNASFRTYAYLEPYSRRVPGVPESAKRRFFCAPSSSNSRSSTWIRRTLSSGSAHENAASWSSTLHISPPTELSAPTTRLSQPPWAPRRRARACRRRREDWVGD